MSGVIASARCDHRHGAGVLDSIRVRVNPLVQVRQDTQREHPEKCRRDECRDKSAAAIIRTRRGLHRAAILEPAQLLCKRFLRGPPLACGLLGKQFR